MDWRGDVRVKPGSMKLVDADPTAIDRRIADMAEALSAARRAAIEAVVRRCIARGDHVTSLRYHAVAGIDIRCEVMSGGTVLETVEFARQ